MTVLQTICCLFIPHFLPSFCSRPLRQIQYWNSKLSRLFYFFIFGALHLLDRVVDQEGPPNPQSEGCYLWACSLPRTDFWAAAMQKPVNHVSVFICVSTNTATPSLQQNQRVCTCSGSGSVTKTNRRFIICLCACVCVCVCVGPGDVWIFVTVDRLRHSRWAGESDGRQGGLVTLQSRAAKKKKMFEGLLWFHPLQLQSRLFNLAPVNLKLAWMSWYTVAPNNTAIIPD